MNCSQCKQEAPENIVFIRKEYICPICVEKPFENWVPLKVELESKYHENKSAHYVYISDLSNNLSKIREHFNENVELTNPMTTITLIYPTSSHMLLGTYDGVYLDKELNDREAILSPISMAPDAYVKLVNGTKMVIVE